MNQRGRGQEPVTVVGRTTSLVAVNTVSPYAVTAFMAREPIGRLDRSELQAACPDFAR